MIAVNDMPELTGSGESISYTENDVAKIIDLNIVITDVDNTELASATIAITYNFNPFQDVLHFTDDNGITGYYNSIAGILTLVGSSSIENYQTALRSITYENSSDEPTTSSRTISFTVNDGQSNSVAITRQIDVQFVNDAPILSSSSTNLAYTENNAASIIDSGVSISDDDTNLANATVAITANFHADQDTLSFTDQNGISGFYDDENGILTLNGTANVNSYQSALRTVKYENLSDDPNTDTRTIMFKVHDGETESNTVTTDVQLTAINDIPTLTGSGGLIEYTENDAATVIDAGVVISDVDNADLTGATISIVQNLNPTQDVLGFPDHDDITGYYNSATGILTLSGSASVSEYQTLLRSIEYENTSDSPTTLTRKISFTVNDGQSNSVAITRQIKVQGINDAPVLLGSAASLAYTENAVAALIDSGITISDDNTNLVNATVAITSNLHSDQDKLLLTDQNGISSVYDSENGILTLTGIANVITYQSALRTIKYENLSEDPNTDTRTVMFKVHDGVTESNTVTTDVQLTAVNDIPTLTGSGGIIEYIENDAATVIDVGITASDADNINLTGATISIVQNLNPTQDVLHFEEQNGITGYYNSATGVLTLTGSASVSAYQKALRSIEYENASNSPTELVRTISFAVNDGQSNSVAIMRQIDVKPINDAPVLTGSETNLAYAENAAAAIIDSGVSISDDDTNLVNATVAITSNFQADQDTLSFTDQNGILGSYDSENGILTLAGTASVITYQSALRTVKYGNLSEDPNTDMRSVMFKVHDGEAESNMITRQLNITPGDDLPQLTGSTSTLTFIENDPQILIDPNITITDIDNLELSSAKISITRNFNPGQDILHFKDQNGIVSFYNSATGILNLDGQTSVANYQEALRTVAYENLSDNPTPFPRTIAFSVNDGSGDCIPITRQIEVIAQNDLPVLSGSSARLDYTENDASLAIEPDLTITSVDDVLLTNATISIVQNFNADQDVLVFNDQNGIMGHYDSSLGVLRLTETSNKAYYQTALRSVKYQNLSEDPNTTTRKISFVVNDGYGNSNMFTKLINVAAVNDLPVLLKNYLAITEGQTVTLTENELNATDADDNDIDLIFTVSNVQHGQFLSNNTKLEITQFKQHNITRGDIQFVHDNKNTAPAYSVLVSDGHSTTAALPAQVDFTPINDPPILERNRLTINQGQSYLVTTADLSAVDEETPKEDLLFTMSEVKQGFFANRDAPSTPITSFLQGDVMNNEIRFTHDGSAISPSYTVTVSDGELNATATTSAAINFVKGQASQTIEEESNFQNQIIGGTIGGAVSLLFLVMRIYLNRRAAQSFQKMTDGYQSGTMKQQAEFQKDVIRPFSKAIFDRVNIKGFFGYINDTTMRRYLDAVMQIVMGLVTEGINVDLAKMTVIEQSKLVSEVARQTQKQFVFSGNQCCGKTSRFFKSFFVPDMSAEELEARATVIAIAVKGALQAGKFTELLAPVEMPLDADIFGNYDPFKNVDHKDNNASIGINMANALDKNGVNTDSVTTDGILSIEMPKLEAGIESHIPNVPDEDKLMRYENIAILLDQSKTMAPT